MKKERTRYGGELTYRQLVKNNAVVVFQVRPSTQKTWKNGWYEVFMYKVHQPDKFHDDEYEMFPSDESFGKWVWNCSDLEVVRKVLREHFNFSESEIEDIIALIRTESGGVMPN